MQPGDEPVLQSERGIGFQRGQVLISDLEDLTVTDKDQLGAVAEARQGTTVAVQARMYLCYFLVAERADTVTDLPFPCRGGGGSQAGKARQPEEAERAQPDSRHLQRSHPESTATRGRLQEVVRTNTAATSNCPASAVAVFRIDRLHSDLCDLSRRAGPPSH